MAQKLGFLEQLLALQQAQAKPAAEAGRIIAEDPVKTAKYAAYLDPVSPVGTMAGILEAFGYGPDPERPGEFLPSVAQQVREAETVGDYVGAGLTSLGAVPLIGPSIRTFRKGATMIEGGPPDIPGGGGGPAPNNVPSNSQIKAKKRELGEAAKKAKSPGATQEDAARFEQLKSELAEMQRLQKDAKPAAAPVNLVPPDEAGIMALGTRTKSQPSRTQAPIEIDNQRPVNTQVSTAVSRALLNLKLPEGNLSGEDFEKLLLKEKGVNKVAYDQSGLRKLIDENRDNPNFVGSSGGSSLFTVDGLMDVVKQKSPQIGLTRLDRTSYEGMQRPDFNLNQVIPAPKEEEIAFTLTARYPDQPSKVKLVSAAHGGVSSENAVVHTRIIPGRYNPNHINDPDGPYLSVDIMGELQGDRAVRTLAERNKDRGIASLDKADVLQNARQRYSERKHNYGRTVRDTFNQAAENSPTARRVFSEYISPSGVNPDATDQETDLIAGLLYFIETELGPDVTPEMVRARIDDLELSLDEPDFVGTTGDRIREGLMPGRPLARLDEGVSVDPEDFFETMKSEDGVRAIVELANDRINTAFVFDDIRLAADEVKETVDAIGRAETNLSTTGAKDILDRDAIELLDVDAQAYRDKKVKVDDFETGIAGAKGAIQNELFKNSSLTFNSPKSLRRQLADTESFQIRLRETFPDISDTTDNPLGDATRYFFNGDDESLSGAIDFITGGSSKSLDDMIAAADDPIAARALVNQYRSDLVARIGFEEGAVKKYQDAMDSIQVLETGRLEAIDELNTEKARLLQKFGSQEALDTGLKQIDEIAERELLVDPPFSSISEGYSQISQAFLSEFLSTRVVDELLLNIADDSGSIAFFDIPANPITKLKEGVIFPSGSIQAQAHNFTRSKELTNQYNVAQKTAIDAFIESNPGVFTVEEIVLDAPRAAGADTDTSYFVRLTPEYKQKVADVVQEISDEHPDPFSTKKEFLRLFQEKMAANTSDVKLKFAKGGEVDLHKGIGAMAREVL